jgi:hypothetical protein
MRVCSQLPMSCCKSKCMREDMSATGARKKAGETKTKQERARQKNIVGTVTTLAQLLELHNVVSPKTF